ELVGKIEIEIKAGEVTASLLFYFVDLEVREEHAAFSMVGMRKRIEAGREGVLRLDLLGRHFGKLFPRDAGRQLDAHALLNRLTAAHLHGRRMVAQVVTLIE